MTSEPSRPLDIIVVGGGLAGLAAAGYLRTKHNVTVLEKYPLDLEKNAVNDYGMSIVANAYKLLMAQGASEDNLQADIFTHLWDRTKENVSERELVFDTRLIFGAPSIFARRSRLQAELYRIATEPSRSGSPVKIVTNVKVASINPIAGEVITEAGEVYRGDLIVGADGINSAVRAAVVAHSSPSNVGIAVGVSEGTQAAPTGLIGYVSSVPAEVITSDPDLAFQAADGVAGICVWKGTDENQLRILSYPCDRKAYFQLFAYAPETAWKDEFERTNSSIVRDVPSARVLQDFEGFHPSVIKMIQSSPTWAVWRIRDIDPLSNWVTGKTVLIGDAAHAVTPHVGQGCNIAIEDAEALGYLLKDITLNEQTSTDFPAASVVEKLSVFQTLRLKRAHLVQFSSRQAGGLLKEEEKERAGPFDRQKFSQMIYGYSGGAAAYKDYLEGIAKNEGLKACV